MESESERIITIKQSSLTIDYDENKTMILTINSQRFFIISTIIIIVIIINQTLKQSVNQSISQIMN